MSTESCETLNVPYQQVFKPFVILIPVA